MHTAPDPSRTALLVIDLQRDFCSPGGYAHQAGIDIAPMQAVVANALRLLQAARTAGLLVVHTREGHLSDLSDCPATKLQRSVDAGAPIGSLGPLGRLLVRGEQGHDFVDAVRPMSGEEVIDKPGYGAFHRTRLAQVLAARDIEQLIVCGVTTEVCVHSTLREAVDRGFACTTVSDATAASNPALQAPALAMIGVEGGIFGLVQSTDEVVASLQGAKVTPPDRVNTWVQAFTGA
ncbi:cysteine hydrolase family protein [Hydrogenophaga sp.]|jgi:nicotinamidase-related amidase|uniref:cysteine hydrolase family protein n=1 Tax=Hydrogenophaga sp. TaxID=1904254 RepID=UPI00271D20CF|nr:isochorismatase family cysteine hydrolase [Hydrogenophaga sp.]MDO9132609.1 isochorismatase family cysteine hydrolase [Hydrogenophaga sp.]MDO9506165.1 isochorismatase family cysteine hydrolase [Hydrogenophaga sp.]